MGFEFGGLLGLVRWWFGVIFGFVSVVNWFGCYGCQVFKFCGFLVLCGGLDVGFGGRFWLRLVLVVVFQLFGVVDGLLV